MPARADLRVIVALAAGLPGRERHHRHVSGLDHDPALVVELQQMDRLCPVAVAEVTDVLGRLRPEVTAQRRESERHTQHRYFRPWPHILNSFRSNVSFFPVATAWLTLSTVTAVSYPISAGQFSFSLPRTALKKFCRCGLW